MIIINLFYYFIILLFLFLCVCWGGGRRFFWETPRRKGKKRGKEGVYPHWSPRLVPWLYLVRGEGEGEEEN